MTTKTVPGLRFLSVLVALAALGIAMAGAARASELHFSYSQAGGGIHFSFDQQSNPTPIADSGSSSWGAYTQIAITNWSGNIDPVSSVYWYPESNGGGFSLPGDSLLSGTGIYGQAVFTGSVADPLFQPGTFTGYYSLGNDCGGLIETTLTVTGVAGTVPEPGSLGLFGSALALLGLAFWTRRRARV